MMASASSSIMRMDSSKIARSLSHCANFASSAASFPGSRPFVASIAGTRKSRAVSFKVRSCSSAGRSSSRRRLFVSLAVFHSSLKYSYCTWSSLHRSERVVSSCVFSAASAVTAASSKAVFTRFFRLKDASRFVSRSILSTSVARESRSRYPRALTTAPSRRRISSRTACAICVRFFWRAATRSTSFSSFLRRSCTTPFCLLSAATSFFATSTFFSSSPRSRSSTPPWNVLELRRSRTVMDCALAS
mmetsp:Transcript_154/g.573  ORF Transcript_154/g.573 Transcript_154/m.573 type:complete len:246 (-) Transcript_154:1863-2600(-)